MQRFLLPTLALGLCALPSLVGAQEVNWGMLDPGDDFSARLLRSALPTIGGDTAANPDTQNQMTVGGHLVGWLSAGVFAVAAFWVLYGTVINIVRTSSHAKALHEGWHWMSFVRMPLALVLMFPLPPTGVSLGQVAIYQVAMRGLGLGQLLYKEAVTAIGPDAVPIATPFIPGTRTIVAGVMQAELCRALVNAASNNANMIPTPQPQTTVMPDGQQRVSWAYRLTTGNATGAPTCGSVSVSQASSGTNILGVSVDMSSEQRRILENVVQQSVRPQVEGVAAALWQTRQANTLSPLMAAYSSAADNYTRQLTAAATTITSRLRQEMRADTMRSGLVNQQRNEDRQAALGISGAGSYSLNFAKLNGATLSLLTNTPTVIPPTYEGLGPNVGRDLAPMVAAVLNWRDTITAFAQVQDGQGAPAGYSDLFAGATPGDDGASVLDRVARSMRFSERLLTVFVDMTSPAKRMFQDPFADQVQLGHKLIAISLTALGMATLLASSTGTAATMAVSALTLNFTGVAAAAVGSMAMSFLGTPIFYALMALLIPGMILAFVLPLLPFGLWLAGITGWIILVIEAWISVSLWMLSHLTFRGAELHGNGTSGYSTLANIFFRPSLMLIGLFFGYVVYAGLAWFLQQNFTVAAGFVLQQGWLITNLLGLALMMCMFVVAHIVIATQSFRLISGLPHHVLTWANMRPANRVDMDRMSQELGAVGMAATLQQINGATNSAFKSAEKALLPPPNANSDDGEKKAGNNSGDRTLNASTDVI